MYLTPPNEGPSAGEALRGHGPEPVLHGVPEPERDEVLHGVERPDEGRLLLHVGGRLERGRGGRVDDHGVC